MSFNYKDVDQEGLDTLNVISSAERFNNWMYRTILPFCNGEILEIGSGVANISQYFVRDGKSVYLSDIRSNYREIIKEKFGYDNSRVFDLDIAATDFNTQYAELLNKFDSIFCLNVVEHIKDDDLAVQNMMKLLRANGQLIVLVPAYQTLYNQFDITLEHYRRYNKKSLNKLMTKHGNLKKSFYFNAAGILGWYVSGKLFKNRNIPAGEMKLYNSLVPVFKIVDKLLINQIGLSVISVIEKIPE